MGHPVCLDAPGFIQSSTILFLTVILLIVLLSLGRPVRHHHGFNVMQCELELINDLDIMQLKIVEVVLEGKELLDKEEDVQFDKEVEVVLDEEEDEFPDKEEAVVLYKEVEVAVDNKKGEDADRDKEK